MVRAWPLASMICSCVPFEAMTSWAAHAATALAALVTSSGTAEPCAGSDESICFIAAEMASTAESSARVERVASSPTTLTTLSRSEMAATMALAVSRSWFRSFGSLEVAGESGGRAQGQRRAPSVSKRTYGQCAGRAGRCTRAPYP